MDQLRIVNANKNLFRPIGAIAAANLFAAGLGAVGGVLVARFVDPSANGQFRVFTIPLMYLTIMHLGTFDGLYRQIPFLVGESKSKDVDIIVAATGAWNVLVSCVLSIGFVFAGIYANCLGDRAAAFGWMSQTAASFAVFYGGFLGATFRTLNGFSVLAGIQLGQAVVGFACILAVWKWGFDGLCIRAFVSSAFLVVLCHCLRPVRVRYTMRLHDLVGVIKIGLPLCCWGVAYSAVWTAIEYTMIVHYGGLRAAGFFSVAVILRESISVLPLSASQVISPMVIESYAKDGGAKMLAYRLARWAFYLTSAMVVVIVSMSLALDYCVPRWIGRYSDGLTLIKICMGLAVVHAACLPLNLLVAVGGSWRFGKGVLAGLIVFPLATIALAGVVDGVIAVAIGSLVGRLVRTSFAYVELWHLSEKHMV